MDGPCSSAVAWTIPDYMASSAWIEHAPFAFWLVDTQRPRVVVELGTYSGFSYLCFCQQVRAAGLPARCFAIDTWQGDAHAGFYGDDVLAALRAHHDPRYGYFSRLIRATFDAALPQFADGSIDLLHIDGRHFYDDVRHDFEAWRPKLSERAIVLFHDIAVRERGFGVHRLWDEISGTYPHFAFEHGHGLGVLGVGSDPAVGQFPIFAAARDAAAARAVRDVYARLGSRVAKRARWQRRRQRWRRILRI